MNRPLALSAALLAALPFSAGAAEKRAFAIADLYAVKGVAEPAIAPDGRSVAFAVTATDLPAIRRQTNLWRVDADGKGARALTLSDKRDASPAFSPDGTVLAFLSTRAGDPQVFFLPTAGGEAEKKTDVPGGVGGFLFTPDGKRLLAHRRGVARVRRRRGLQPQEGRGHGEGEDEGVRHRSPLRPPLGLVGGRQAHARARRRPRRREVPAARPDPGRLRLPRLRRGRRRRLRRLARRQGARLHVQP